MVRELGALNGFMPIEWPQLERVARQDDASGLVVGPNNLQETRQTRGASLITDDEVWSEAVNCLSACTARGTTGL